MHLKLMRSELRMEGVQPGAPPRTINHGKDIISTDMLWCSTGVSPSPRAWAPSLNLYSPPAEDTAALLDMWAVIKPGHVREKIAIFALEVGQTTAAGERNHTSSLGITRAGKVKGSWEENGNAKRQRRSASNQNLQQNQGSWSVRAPPYSVAQCPGSGCGDTEGEEHKVSVGEMVTFLERRLSAHQADPKPLLTLHRSSAAPPSQDKGEEPECVKVSDMVAKLESKCLRRRNEGCVSRSNTLRRTVGRVLLAAAHHCPALSPHSQSCLSGSSVMVTPPSLSSGMVESDASRGLEAPPSLPEEAEPPPGLLFLSPPAAAFLPQTCTHLGSTPLVCTELTFDPNTSSSQPCHIQSEKSFKVVQIEEKVGAVGLRASTSHAFLELRQRLRQLLEPPLMGPLLLSALPQDVLVNIFVLLPTRTLAALKCTCHQFKFIIDNYSVRPADSLWVSDPHYRDDPCKQCKRRYVRGDVSLCRWHHKPYCQALPYGPGYWMCCYGAHRDTPGCNLGLHDNRWVPSFHSINAPICCGNAGN
ncbi:F-box only protein 34 [Dunckerocampus dactyliophorus]|uniref:F-box only protein 34 n=1 Tax=Dunckerocampus dactyliophorus TaxID=161453 RepID=UPI0024062D91|nr:F-box only protein 34 [Dunckerocampus dactyliophorus]